MTDSPNAILSMAALEYTKAALHVVALTGKRPNGRVHGDSWSYEDSFHGEVTTPEELAALDHAFSNDVGTTGIAILIPPDFLVADVDSDRAAERLLATGWVASEDSVIAKTKNGLHVWFWYPGADRNRWLGDGRVEDFGDNRALLLKGLGGYVVAPPSLHFDAEGNVDGTYLWAEPLIVEGRLRFPDILPGPVVDIIRAEDQFSEMKAPKESLSHFNLEPEDGVPWYRWKPVWVYATEGLEHAIETAADGNQNNVIHWAAMTAREEGVPYELAMDRLLAAAIKGGHPKNRARDTIRGAYKRAPRG